ncbi:MAG: ABC transporter permease, partial [Deltaproteobacteria bacterium]|nr:ABC transporter permease [Deltaproteobacteria bacterium]
MTLDRFFALLRKELRELGRDRVLVIFIIYAFTADVYIAAEGIRISLTRAATSILDQDRTATSRELVGRLPSRYFSMLEPPANERELLARLDAGEALFGLVIPPGFERDLAQRGTAPVQLFLDGTQSAHASQAEAYVQEVVAEFSREIVAKRMGAAGSSSSALPLVEPVLRVRFNPNRVEIYFEAISEMLSMMAFLAILIPAATLIREREHGTIEQLLVSPVTPAEILLAKTTASTLVLLAGTAVCVFGLLLPVIDVPVRGSLLLFFACTAIFAFSMSGIGLMVASIARTMPQVAMLSLLVVAPIILLSGAWTPPEAMPDWLARTMFISPLRWFNDVTYGIFLRGAHLGDLTRPVLAMLGLGAVFYLW